MATAKRTVMVAGATLGASAVFATGAQAATTYTVTGTGDSGGSCDVNNNCTTLRAAIDAANTDGGSDTIVFENGLSGTITLSGSPLSISDNGGLTIDGPGASTLSIDGGGSSRVFYITSNFNTPVDISGLTITDGSAGGSIGGAIANIDESSLTLSDDVVSGSTGGGVYSNGRLTMTGTTVSDNSSTSGAGGGVLVENSNGTDTITNSTITGNTARAGGGIASYGAYPAIDNSKVTDNKATNSTAEGGGGILGSGGQLTLSGATVSGNTSAAPGGGIKLSTTQGTHMTASTISANSAPSGGGLAIAATSSKYNPTAIDQTTISGNQAPLGAGVDVAELDAGNPVTIGRSTLSGNQGGPNSFGGGVLIEGHAYSPFRLIDSTISGNSATQGGGASLGYDGKAPFFGNSTQGTVEFDNSTIAANSASAAAGGIYLAQYNTGSGAKSEVAGLKSTIVAGNTAAGAPQDLARAAGVSNGGFNGAFSLIQNSGGVPFLSSQSDINGVNPQLGALQNNGGPTETMLPSGTSPVIDQGHAPLDLNTDQRGDPRTVPVAGLSQPPGGDGTDIGSVELPASSVVVPGAGFSASIHGRLIGGSPVPLLVGGKIPVTCTVKSGTLDSCVIKLYSANGTLLASGSAITNRAVNTLSTHVRITIWGRYALAKHPLGLIKSAKVFGRTSASGRQRLTGNVRLLGDPVTLKLGKQAKLPSALRGELAQLARFLQSGKARSITCTAYSNSKRDKALTSTQAKSACKLVKADGFKGKVSSAGNAFSGSRRLVLKFSF